MSKLRRLYLIAAVCLAGIIFIAMRQQERISPCDPPSHPRQALSDLDQTRTPLPNSIHLTESDKEAIYKAQVSFQAKSNASHYLRFINTLHGDLIPGTVPEKAKKELEDLIRSGHGLEPYVTDQGQVGWIENGIVYRPWREPDPSTVHKKYPSPYKSEYEMYIPFNEELFFEGKKPDPSYKTQQKIILWHTTPRYIEPKKDLEPLQVCPNFPCYVTTNRKYSESSSAMIFAAQILESAPPKRRPDQIFILHNHEPPYVNKYFDRAWREGFKQPGWKQAFNWTMTYRMDSDLIIPYGVVRKRPTPLLNKDYKDIVAKKTRSVVWMVSNCDAHSERGKYIKEMNKFIEIDTYGACGKLKCVHQDGQKCAQMITKTYKFFLGFENAFCPDYITEKIFYFLTMDTITVVRGIDQYFEHVPRELFINAADFPTPKALAERLNYLDKNDDAYIEMLKEKDKYMAYREGFPVRNPDGYIRSLAHRIDSPAICLACLRLWSLDKYAKSEQDIHKWFDKKLCHKAQDLNF